jgi:hypothetical protein
MLETIADVLLPSCCSHLLSGIGIELSQGLDPDLFAPSVPAAASGMSNHRLN